jgi:hypothetical protein
MSNRLPTQITRYVKQFVHTGDQNDIEQIILAIENLISRDKKFVLTLNQEEEFTFSFLPKKTTLGNEIIHTTKIELFFDPSDPDAASIKSHVFPFEDKPPDEIKKSKKWIVFFIYDLIQQFGIDLEWYSHIKIIRTANAHLTPKTFAQLLKTCRTTPKQQIPRWYLEYNKLLNFIRVSQRHSLSHP